MFVFVCHNEKREVIGILGDCINCEILKKDGLFDEFQGEFMVSDQYIDPKYFTVKAGNDIIFFGKIAISIYSISQRGRMLKINAISE